MGHDFGDIDVDREREERGSEVVVTITEYERCRRCGATSVISENTEVTAAGSTATTEGESSESAIAAESGSTREDREFDPDVDDGVILEQEPEAPAREYGEWPRSDSGEGPLSTQSPRRDDRSDAATESPDQKTEDSPTSEESQQSTAGRRSGESRGLEREDSRHRPDAGTTENDDEGFVRYADAPTPTEQSVDSDVPTEIFCPNCGSRELGKRHSLRAGDICPECRTGYVAEREI